MQEEMVSQENGKNVGKSNQMLTTYNNTTENV